jgi:ABC-type lipoprotein export system ATPase subunit
MSDSAVLEFDGVCKSFARGEHRIVVLEDASLSLSPGRVAAVIAERGQGKTALLELAAGLLAPDSGSVRVHGRELSGLKNGEWCKMRSQEIGLTSREPPALRCNVAEHVQFSLQASKQWDRKGRRARLAQTLELLSLEDCAKRRWHELSNWERVRAELAQAVAVEPALLLIDDLFRAVSLRELQTGLDLLEDLARDTGCAVLIAAADHRSGLRSSLVYRLRNGKLRLMCDGD